MKASKLLTLGLLGGGGAAFSPLSIPGLALWLDASDASTLFQASNGTTPATADGDVVGYWGDKSGNGKHATQATTGNKPTLQTAEQNGRSVILWDAADDYLSVVVSLSQPSTVVSIFRPGVGDFPYLFDGHTVGSRNSIQAGASGTMFAGNGGNLGAISADTEFIGSFTYNGADSAARLNGTPIAVGDVGAQNVTTLILGNRYSLNFGLNGYIAEILWYAGALTAPQIAALEAYLNAKWGAY